MKLRHLFSLGLLFAGFSCSVEMHPVESDVAMDDQAQKSPGPTSYPEDPAPQEPVDVPPDDPWRCGSEWIVVDGPNGEKIYSEIPMLCDPMADVYLGCPPDSTPLEK